MLPYHAAQGLLVSPQAAFCSVAGVCVETLHPWYELVLSEFCAGTT